jgi:hypothetical protein
MNYIEIIIGIIVIRLIIELMIDYTKKKVKNKKDKIKHFYSL